MFEEHEKHSVAEFCMERDASSHIKWGSRFKENEDEGIAILEKLFRYAIVQ